MAEVLAGSSRPVVIRRLDMGSNCICVHSLLFDKPCDWLVDTGASVSVLNSCIYFEIENVVRPPLAKCSVECLAADGKAALKVYGSCMLNVVMGQHSFCVPVIVADLGDLNAILGMNFIRLFNFTIDPTNSLLKSCKHGFVIPTFELSTL